MIYDFYAELKAWQTAIGAAIGFVALILGALFNSHLNRRRDTRLRHEEAIGVATALYGEIVLLRRETARIGNMIAARYTSYAYQKGEAFDKHFVEDHNIPDEFIYKALADKLGLLNPNLIISIAEFYQNLQEVRSWIPRLKNEETRGYNYSILNVLHPAREAVTRIGPSLREIEKMAKLQNNAETPEISKIEEVIDIEGSIWSDPD